jgi:hypothetical protein
LTYLPLEFLRDKFSDLTFKNLNTQAVLWLPRKTLFQESSALAPFRTGAMEDGRKLSVILLTFVFMGVAFANQATTSSDKESAPLPKNLGGRVIT